mmetsp:Transcript_44341/g.102487  ORF Transcript_44341/g.102487 Transcript_44341/m.102487 type:complete len:370 (-) Transcript_44341:589-1698(-)
MHDPIRVQVFQRYQKLPQSAHVHWRYARVRSRHKRVRAGAEHRNALLVVARKRVVRALEPRAERATRVQLRLHVGLEAVRVAILVNEHCLQPHDVWVREPHNSGDLAFEHPSVLRARHRVLLEHDRLASEQIGAHHMPRVARLEALARPLDRLVVAKCAAGHEHHSQLGRQIAERLARLWHVNEQLRARPLNELPRPRSRLLERVLHALHGLPHSAQPLARRVHVVAVDPGHAQRVFCLEHLALARLHALRTFLDIGMHTRERRARRRRSKSVALCARLTRARALPAAHARPLQSSMRSCTATSNACRGNVAHGWRVDAQCVISASRRSRAFPHACCQASHASSEPPRAPSRSSASHASRTTASVARTT